MSKLDTPQSAQHTQTTASQNYCLGCPNVYFPSFRSYYPDSYHFPLEVGEQHLLDVASEEKEQNEI